MIRTCTDFEDALMGDILERVVADLTLVADREIALSERETRWVTRRPAGVMDVHLSFRMMLTVGEQGLPGTLLLPRAEAIALASYLVMLHEEAVKDLRGQQEIDTTIKDALLELGNFVAGATDQAFKTANIDNVSARTAGCQGVKPGIRPKLRYNEGDPLLVSWAKMQVHTYPEFEAILILPNVIEALTS